MTGDEFLKNLLANEELSIGHSNDDLLHPQLTGFVRDMNYINTISTAPAVQPQTQAQPQTQELPQIQAPIQNPTTHNVAPTAMYLSVAEQEANNLAILKSKISRLTKDLKGSKNNIKNCLDRAKSAENANDNETVARHRALMQGHITLKAKLEADLAQLSAQLNQLINQKKSPKKQKNTQPIVDQATGHQGLNMAPVILLPELPISNLFEDQNGPYDGLFDGMFGSFDLGGNQFTVNGMPDLQSSEFKSDTGNGDTHLSDQDEDEDEAEDLELEEDEEEEQEEEQEEAQAQANEMFEETPNTRGDNLHNPLLIAPIIEVQEKANQITKTLKELEEAKVALAAAQGTLEAAQKTVEYTQALVRSIMQKLEAIQTAQIIAPELSANVLPNPIEETTPQPGMVESPKTSTIPNESTLSKEKQKNAERAGSKAGRSNSAVRPTADALRERHNGDYTDEEITLYLDAFDKAKRESIQVKSPVKRVATRDITNHNASAVLSSMLQATPALQKEPQNGVLDTNRAVVFDGVSVNKEINYKTAPLGQMVLPTRKSTLKKIN